MECKDRKNRSAIILPYTFLPSMAAKKLRNAADKVCIIVNPANVMDVYLIGMGIENFPITDFPYFYTHGYWNDSDS